MDVILQRISIGEKLTIGRDLNNHIDRNNNKYEWVNEGFCYGVRNEGSGNII